MSTKRIVVVGATGVLGGAVVQHFSRIDGWSISAITRNTTSEASCALKRAVPTAELVTANLDDEDSLYQAFQNAHAVFTPTYYWKIVTMSTVKHAGEEQCVDLHGVAKERERQQYHNIFNALARVVLDQEASGSIMLERIILSSLPSPREYTLAYHFVSKSNGIAYLNDALTTRRPGFQQVFDRTSYIYIGAYLDSFFSKSYLTVDGRHLLGPQKADDRSFLFRQVSHAPHQRIPMIYVQKDLGPLIKALVQRAPPRTHLLRGQPLTLEEFAKRWGRALRVLVRWESIGIDEMVREFPKSAQSFVRTASHAAAFVTQYGFDGGMGAKWPSELGIRSDELIDVEQWVKEGDWSRWL